MHVSLIKDSQYRKLGVAGASTSEILNTAVAKSEKVAGESWTSLPQKGLQKPSYPQLIEQCSNLSLAGQGNPVICPSAAEQLSTLWFCLTGYSRVIAFVGKSAFPCNWVCVCVYILFQKWSFLEFSLTPLLTVQILFIWISYIDPFVYTILKIMKIK